MGRRARTNCSPIDSAMEKYHNDIGSRLSGVFVPPQSGVDVDTNATEVLNTFTLDMRSKNNHHLQDNASAENFNNTDSYKSCERDDSSSNNNSHHQLLCSENSQTLSSSLIQTFSLTVSSSVTSKSTESNSCADDKEKRGLVDKLTRALFQRKHTCTRCQRKSRSCLPNKNFNSSDKHYMCGRCRESNHVMKNLVSGQNSLSPTNSGIRLTNSPVTSDVILPKPRIHLKDSGYETVTSCSTVASSHSHNSSTINGSSIKPQFLNNNSRLGDLDLSQNENKGTPCQDCLPNQQSNTHCYPVQTSYGNPAGLEQYMGVTRDESPVRILKQVKTRYVENYDGYLPNTQNSQACAVTRPTLPANTSAPTIDATNHTCDSSCDNTCNSSDQNKCVHSRCSSSNNNKKNARVCYTCRSSSKPCFRLPWEGGWLCEDCLDGVY